MDDEVPREVAMEEEVRESVCRCVGCVRITIVFEGNSTRIEVSKQKESIIEILKERFQEERYEEDWRIPIKEALMKEGDMVEWKALKDYALVKGEL